MAVADRGCSGDCLGNLARGDMIGPECAQTNCGHGGAGRELSLGDLRRVNRYGFALDCVAHSNSLPTRRLSPTATAAQLCPSRWREDFLSARNWNERRN